MSLPVVPKGPLVALVYKVAAGKRSELLEHLKSSFPFYERPGGIRMALYESLSGDGRFLELVAYASEKDYAEDQARVDLDPAYHETLTAWRALLAGSPEVLSLKAVDLARQDLAVGPANAAIIASVWRERWGLPVCSLERHFSPGDVEGLAITREGKLCGLVTWVVDGTRAEVVTLDALDEGRGVGSRLVREAEQALAARGVAEARLFTTNDNLRSLNFWLRRGWRLAAVHEGAAKEQRSFKPTIPEIGDGGIPVRDLWELRRTLSGTAS